MGGLGVQKDYMITGGGGDLKGPKKGLRNKFVAPYQVINNGFLIL